MRVIAAAYNHKGLENVSGVPIVFFKTHEPDFVYAGDLSIIKLPENINFAWPEVEVAMLIDKRRGGIAKIIGWSVANDVTADYGADCHYLFGKSISSFCKISYPFDTSILPHAKMTTYVNGEEIQDGNLNEMLLSPRELVALIDSRVELETGDIVLSGTPFHEKHRLCVDDYVKVCVEGLGVIESRVE